MTLNGHLIPDKGILISENLQSKLDYQRVEEFIEFTISEQVKHDKQNGYHKILFRKPKNVNIQMTENDFLTFVISNNYIKQIMGI
jgi:hypothetical protein